MTSATDIVLNPLIVFVVYLMLALIIYAIGNSVAPTLKKNGWKLMPYACGEEFPHKKLRPNYNFYHIAYLFTIVHVGALMTCTAFNITAYTLPLFYLLLVLFGIFVLVLR
jgi:NADH:ubiquinone oxidoreductase subunit 3 (subunit A)